MYSSRGGGSVEEMITFLGDWRAAGLLWGKVQEDEAGSSGRLVLKRIPERRRRGWEEFVRFSTSSAAEVRLCFCEELF